MPYIDFQSPANQVSKDESEDNNGSEKMILSKRIGLRTQIRTEDSDSGD